MASRAELETAIYAAVDKHRPRPRANSLQDYAEYVAWDVVEKMARSAKARLGDKIKERVTFDDDATTADVYINGTFMLTAVRRINPKTFDRAKAMVSLATRFNLSAEEAASYIEQEFYRGGTDYNVSLLAKML